MSKTKKVVLILTAIFLVCLIGAGIVVGSYFNSGNDFSSFFSIFGGSTIDINEGEALALDDVSLLSIDCVSGNIYIAQAEDARVELKGKLLGKQEQTEYLDVYEQDGTLHVIFDLDSSFLNIGATDIQMTVYLPAENMLDVNIFSASGDIHMEDGEFGDVAINNTSGDAKIYGCAGNKFELNSISGDTDIENLDFDSIQIVSQSGDIDVLHTSAAVTIRSTSGSINIEDALGALDINSTSGGATVDLSQEDIMPININVVSGGVRLYLNKNAAFDLSAKATSGDVSTDFDITVSGSTGSFVNKSISGKCNGGGALVNITTVSGGIRIMEK